MYRCIKAQEVCLSITADVKNKMTRSTYSDSHSVASMTSLKAAPGPSQDPSFKTGSNNAHDGISISAWEASLNEERTPTAAGLATAVHNDGPVEFGNSHIDNRRTNEEDMIAPNIKPAVTEMVTNNLLTMVEESLDDNLGTSFYNIHIGTRSEVYIVAEQVMLDQLRKDIFGEMLDACT